MPKKTEKQAQSEAEEVSEAARILGNSFRSTEAEFPDAEPSGIHIAFEDPQDMSGHPEPSQDETEPPIKDDDLIFAKPAGHDEDDLLLRVYGEPDLSEQADDGREKLLTELMVQLSAARVPHHIIVAIGKLENEPIQFDELKQRAVDVLDAAITEYEPKTRGFFSRSQAELVARLVDIRRTIDIAPAHQDRPRKVSGERAA